MPAYNLKARIGKLQELEARGVIKPEHQQELETYRAQGIAAGEGAKEKTTAQDQKTAADYSATAAAERDALRTYANAAGSVERFNTGPIKSRLMDAIMPDEDGGFWDAVGATVGAVARPFVSQKTIEARDQLKTVNANVALAGSNLMKGSSSDKDTALMRLSGMGPSKTVAENKRIIRDATYNSGLSQTRALVASNWLAEHGSLTAPGHNGMTFQKALMFAEKQYDKHIQASRAARKLPKAPPRRRGGPITIDLDGNPIQ